MRIAIVVAATDAGVIGKDNALPWRLPDDLKRFKQITLGKPVVMGRRTYESIGKALPGRLNIVVTRRIGFEAPGCTVVSSIAAALLAANDASEICVIGGGEIYNEILPRVDTIYLTRVHAELDGDVFLPALATDQWRETQREEHPADDRHPYSFSFLTLEREA
jgi:dihydrofolate reductase